MTGGAAPAAELGVAVLLEACKPPKTKRVDYVRVAASAGEGGEVVAVQVGAQLDAEEDEDELGSPRPLGTTLGETAGTIASPPLTGRASMRSGMSGLRVAFNDSDVEVEAERLFLSAYASDVLSRHGAEGGLLMPPNTGASRASSAGKGRYAPTLEPLPPVPPDFVLSTYVLDFGHVIKGTQKKKVFKLRNAGWNYVSLDIDKNAIAPYGLRVEPDKLVKLPGLPDPETAEFTVTFASKAPKVGLGRVVQELRLQLKPGPPVAIIIKANVTIPEVKVTVPTSITVSSVEPNSIDFGNVIVGRCSTATVELYNPKEVVAEWKVNPPLENAKDFDRFVCLPDSGNLAPGARLQMQIRFSPNTERPFGVRLMIKVANNNKPVYLNVLGQGKELKVATQPDSVMVPAVQPHADAASAFFRLTNPSDYPIEVYSYDFDGLVDDKEHAFLHYEAMVREDTLVPTVQNDALLLPLREPGDPFWQSISDGYEERKAAALAAELGEEVPPPPPAPEAVGELEAPPEPVELKQRTLIMLTPAPLARSAELAKELAFAYQVPAVLLAEVVAAEDRRLRDEAWAAQEAGREARVADAMAAAEAAGTEYVPTEEEEYVEPEAPPGPLDPANISGCIAAALSREKRPDGAVIVMPEQPTVFATKEQLLEAVVLALGYAPPPPPEPPPDPKAKKGAPPPPPPPPPPSAGEPVWSFALQTTLKDVPPLAEGDEGYVPPTEGEAPALWVPKGEETVEARAAAQLAAEIDAMPKLGPIPDMEEEAYEALEPKAREQFEMKRREHRRRLAVADAKVAAAKMAYAFRLVQLQEASAGFASLEQAASAKFFVAPPEPPPPEPEPEGGWPEGEAPAPWQPPRGLAGHYAIDASLPLDAVTELVEACLFERPPPIPEVPPPPPIPLPFGNQILKRTKLRAQRPVPIGLLDDAGRGRLYTIPPPPPKPDVEEGVEPPPEEPPPEPTQQTRWVLPPKESVQLRVDYKSALIGPMQHALKFEVMCVGESKAATLQVGAMCARPSISTDPRNVFNRKVKAKDQLKVKKAYVVQRQCFEFGPLLAKRPRPVPNDEGVSPPPHKDHETPLHISNNSPFPVTVQFSFLGDGKAVHTPMPLPFTPPPALVEEEGSETKDAAPPAVDMPTRPADAGPVFFLRETTMTLEPDETKDLYLSAFPDMNGLFDENLICTITNNPEPVQFPISCIGSTPAVALSSQTVEFQRLLMGRSDTKVVQIASRSALPQRWSIVQADLDAIGEQPAAEPRAARPSCRATPSRPPRAFSRRARWPAWRSRSTRASLERAPRRSTSRSPTRSRCSVWSTRCLWRSQPRLTTSKSRSNGRAKRPLPQRRPCTWASTLARSRWSTPERPHSSSSTRASIRWASSSYSSRR